MRKEVPHGWETPERVTRKYPNRCTKCNGAVRSDCGFVGARHWMGQEQAAVEHSGGGRNDRSQLSHSTCSPTVRQAGKSATRPRR